MASLVTLGSAPYNPYNDTFGRYAMQGLQMGMQMMQHKDNLMQRQVEHQSSLISESVNNLFKGQEMQMRNKELNHRIENDLFNRILDEKKFEFTKTAHAQDVEDRRKDFGLRERDFDFRKEKWEKYDAPHQVELTKALADENAIKKETWNERVQIQRMQVAKEAIGISQAAQALRAGQLTNDFNEATQAARIQSANLAPTKTALEISQTASDIQFMTPERREEAYQTDKAFKQSQTEENLAQGKYYAGGGAARKEALARSVEVRDIIGSQSTVTKDRDSAKAKMGSASANIKMYEANLNSGKIKPGTKEYEIAQKELAKEREAFNDSKSALATLDRQVKMAQDAAEKILKLYNKVLLDKGKDPINTGAMTPEQKANAALDAIIELENEEAASSGRFPGESPAGRAASEAAAGKPIGEPSKNPLDNESDEDEAAF